MQALLLAVPACTLSLDGGLPDGLYCAWPPEEGMPQHETGIEHRVALFGRELAFARCRPGLPE